MIFNSLLITVNRIECMTVLSIITSSWELGEFFFKFSITMKLKNNTNFIIKSLFFIFQILNLLKC